MTKNSQPRNVRRFHFVDYELDEATLTAGLRYGPGFCEEVVFDGGQLLALALLAGSDEWRDDRLVHRFAAEILPGLDDPGRLIEEAMRPTGVESLPAAYRSMLPRTSDAPVGA